MAKRIYEFNYKKWGTIVGISSVTLVGLLFAYLSFLGVIEITGYSGDSVCDGTIDDPCYAYINLTAKEDVFIYPIGYDPWGRNTTFLFSPGVKDWKLQRSWGKSWRNIPLDKTCTGTWCGAPNNKGVKYSYVLREGRDYQFRIVAYKNSPFEIIKWSVDYDGKEYLDPKWDSQFDIPESTQDKLKYKDYQDSLRQSDSSRVKVGNFYKSYNASTKTILIENNKYDTLAEFKLLTNYRQHVGVGNDTKIASLFLIDFVNASYDLFDVVNSYNVKNDYSSENKIFILKYRTDWIEEMSYIKETFDNETNQSISNETIYYNQSRTNWTEFTRLDELPHKNIEIGIFTDTVLGEEIEWVPTIRGVEILEYASYLVDGLISYWKFDDTYSDELDVNNGINSGTTFSSGKINNAAVFDSTDKITVGTTGFPSGDSSRSYSMWINPTSVSIYQTVFLTGTYSNNNMFGLVFLNGREDTLSVWGWANDHYGAFVFTTGNWYHLVVTYDSSTSTLKTYINGNIDIDEVTSDFNTVFGIATIGYSLTLSGRTFNGKIDEFATWDYSLNQTAVDDLYNSDNGWQYPFSHPSVFLISPENNYYNTNLGSINFVCDVSSNTSIVNVTFYTNYSGNFIENGTNSSGVSGNYIFTRDIQNFNDFVWNCYACDNENKCDFASNNYFVDMVNLTLQITDPTTANPNNVLEGDNISINFNFLENGINITSGVNLENVIIGGIDANLVGGGIEVFEIDYEDFEGYAELYEGNIGNWVQATFDDDAWGVYTGNGQSGGTGPTSNYDGYYGMVETSSGQCNTPDTAIIYRSPEIDFDSYIEVNISFAYHMYGTTMGTLHIKENSTGSWLSVWSETGNLGDIWFTANQNMVGLTGSGNIAVWLDCGASFTSDAAIDSIKITGTTGGFEFGYVSDIGWQVNVTMPSGSGYEDLFLNATYLGSTRNNTQTNAINYGGAEDTCTYTSGDWEIDCSDDCVISSDVAMGGNDLVFSNAGTFHMSANITGYGNINLNPGCYIILDDNTFLINIIVLFFIPTTMFKKKRRFY